MVPIKSRLFRVQRLLPMSSRLPHDVLLAVPVHSLYSATSQRSSILHLSACHPERRSDETAAQRLRRSYDVPL